jgi:hypothetical protein
MLNPKMIRQFWLTVPAIAGAMLMGANGAIATETKATTKDEPAAVVSIVAEQAITDSILPAAPLSLAVESNRLASNTPVPAAPPILPMLASAPDQPLRSAPSVAELESEGIPPKSAPVAPPTINQVTSVTQLSDLKPTDWAYQAVQSLVERYGCIIGNPNTTFQGNRAATRFELAAALNACLDEISDRFATKEDLLAVRRLQEEFAKELATLKGRVNNLEARTAKLEAQQFTTTTKLRGLAVINVTGAFAGDPITAERNPFVPDIPFAPPNRRNAANLPSQVQRDNNTNIVANYLVYLNLTTSFTGKDQLVTQLAVGNGSSPTNQFVSSGLFNTWGNPFLESIPAPNGAASTVVLRELFYTFPVGKNLRITAGPRINIYRFFDNNRFTFFMNGATSSNSNGSTLSHAVDRGAGAVIAWTINPKLRFSVAYLGQSNEFLENNSSSDPLRGLFDGTNTLTGELAYSPTRNFNVRFHYSRSTLGAGANGFVSNKIIAGIIDDGFGGAVDDASTDTFILNFDWLIAKNFGIFGRYSYGSTNVNPINPARNGGKVQTQSIQFGFAFPDVGKKGAMGLFSFVIPNDNLSGRRFLLSGGGNGATQYDLEWSYYYPLTNNIAIVPAFYTIINANSFDSNPTVFVGNLRMQFTF